MQLAAYIQKMHKKTNLRKGKCEDKCKKMIMNLKFCTVN